MIHSLAAWEASLITLFQYSLLVADLNLSHSCKNKFYFDYSMLLFILYEFIDSFRVLHSQECPFIRFAKHVTLTKDVLLNSLVISNTKYAHLHEVYRVLKIFWKLKRVFISVNFRDLSMCFVFPSIAKTIAISLFINP